MIDPSLASEKKLILGVGLLSQNFSRVSGGVSGNPGLGTIYPEVHLSYDLFIGAGYSLSPWVLYTPMLRISRDGGDTTNVLALALRLKKDLSSSLSANLGVGEFIYRMYGPGGTTTLNNGNSTATFALPSGSVASTLFTVNTGFGFAFSETWRTDLDMMVVNLFSAKRAFNAVLSVGYGIL
ncbi:MAG: hypothetical protein KA715_07275 [Xanthomonadaceae bacterium]|nr:hypothetical protein [Xanthomonadaceae bacterium]